MQPKRTAPAPVCSPFDGLSSWADLSLSRAADGAVAVSAAAAGVLADLAVRSGGDGLAGALLALNVVNPEALVVRRNVALAERTGRFDPGYLTGLSADAVPQIVRSLPRLTDAGRSALLAHVCAVPEKAEGGWAAWNAAEDAAIEARNAVCR